MMQPTPPANQVDLWLVALDDPAAAQSMDLYRSILAPEETARADRLVNERHRCEFLVARALVRSVLSQYAGIPPALWRFDHNQRGKPHVIAPLAPGLGFNLSHTDGLVVCAVAESGHVGVDAECVDRDVEPLPVARNFFAPVEEQMLLRAAAAERRRLFCRIWTLKEAFLKACGEGLSLPLDQFAALPSDDGPPVLEPLGPRAAETGAWRMAQLELRARHYVAVCAEHGDGRPLQLGLRWLVPLGNVTNPQIVTVDRGLLRV